MKSQCEDKRFFLRVTSTVHFTLAVIDYICNVYYTAKVYSLNLLVRESSSWLMKLSPAMKEKFVLNRVGPRFLENKAGSGGGGASKEKMGKII